MVLGFRQLASERWGASPLYVLDFTKRGEGPAGQGRSRRIARAAGAAEEGPAAAAPNGSRSPAASPREQGTRWCRASLTLKLNTLNTVGIGETDYWLDSGSVIR